jgi:hypothetical protein
MSAESKNLLSLQRNFMAAIREPVFGDSRELTSLPARAGEVSPEFFALAEDEIISTPNLEARERLELYHRQYWFRLLDSMDEDFPVLKRLLGKENFWRLIEAYLELVPSRSFTLRHLGSGLADFLRVNPGLAGGRPVHAAELARLEYALCETFEQPKRLAVAPEKIAETALALQPHLRLFAFHTPADEIWRLDDDAAISDELLAPPAGEAKFHVAIFRHAARQIVRRIEAKEFSLLQTIATTGSLAAALDDSNASPEEVSAWFQSWTEFGWLCECEQPGKIEITESANNRKSINIPLHHNS